MTSETKDQAGSTLKLSRDMTAVRDLVRAYCSKQRHPELKTFDVLGPFDQESLLGAVGSNGSGCYAIYDEDGHLKYIGMSEGRLGGRALSQLKRAKKGGTFWEEGVQARQIDIITVSEPWEPYSLEIYLTKKTEAARNEARSRTR